MNDKISLSFLKFCYTIASIVCQEMSNVSTEELLKRLDEQHQAYLETFKLVHEALNNNSRTNTSTVSAASASSIRTFTKRRRRSTKDDGDIPEQRPSTLHSSVLSGDSDDSDDDDDDLYVQTPLAPYNYNEEQLRQHFRTYNFTDAGHIILQSVITKNGRLLDPVLFPEYHRADRSHNSHYSVFDVGKDGAPLSRRDVVKPGTTKIDSAIWQAVKVSEDFSHHEGLMATKILSVGSK